MEGVNIPDQIKYWEEIERIASRQLTYAQEQLSKLAINNTEE